MATLSPHGLRLAAEAQRLIADAKAARLAAGSGIPDGWDRAIEQQYPDVWQPYRVSVPGGWCDLVAAFSLQLRRHAPGCSVADCKEKYGYLRLDCTGDADMQRPWLLEQIYESVSEGVCQDCGERGSLQTDRGRYATLCDKHAVVREFR